MIVVLGTFIWKGLPDDIRLLRNVNTFKHKTKLLETINGLF